MNPLADSQVRSFKREGFLVVRNVLDSELMARARKRMWDGAPSSLKEEDPTSWIGPFSPSEESTDKENVRKHYSWKYREPGRETWMIELLATNRAVWSMAEQLLGAGTLARPERIRGIYSTLPEGDLTERKTRCHVDAHPFHLGVVGYIDTVAPKGGAFTVWPKSHATFFNNFYSRYRMEPAAKHAESLETINKQEYVDCHGDPGDIVFWHHRLGHAAGHNRSSQIRKAILYDFRKVDLSRTQEEPPSDDMWCDWSDAVRKMEP